MKRVVSLSALALASLVCFNTDALAQKKKKAPAKKTNTKKAAATPAVEPPPPPPDPTQSQEYKDSVTRAGLTPSVLESKRPNTTVVGELVDLKLSLPYDNIRIDDQVYKQILWKDVYTSEKMNTIFRYEGENDRGSENFFYIMMGLIKNGDVTAFDAVNDRFTTPLNIGQVAASLGTVTSTIEVPDLDLDPTGEKGIMKSVTVTEEFNVNKIVAYRIKEEVIFDRETSRLHFRTLGIAPLMEKEVAGQPVVMPMFWVYYPEARPHLATYEAYNPKNMAARMSWEEIFESRYYSGTIYKSTLNNPNNLNIKAMIKDPIHRLWAGEDIKESIFNWEQDVWEY